MVGSLTLTASRILADSRSKSNDNLSVLLTPSPHRRRANLPRMSQPQHLAVVSYCELLAPQIV